MNDDRGYFDFVVPTKVKFGPGMRSEIAREIESRDFRSIGIVATKEIVELGLLDDIEAELKEIGRRVEIFAGVTGNPHLSTVSDCYRRFAKFSPDCLVGFGGGSAIDVTKAAALCLANDETDLVNLNDREEVEPAAPYFAVPTTSGTGSEVDYWAVISDPETKSKLSIGRPEMSPLTAVIDPELTLTLPPELTYYTGLDAFSHALEAYFSSESNELSDVLARKSMELVFESLETAVNRGEDLSARGDMALASSLGGAAMQHVGLGLIHAMSHQVSGFYDTNHGLANSLLMLPVLEFNEKTVPDKVKDLENYLGGGLTDKVEELFEIRDISKDRVRIKEDDLSEMVERAATNVNAETNPRPADRDEIERLYRESFTVV